MAYTIPNFSHAVKFPKSRMVPITTSLKGYFAWSDYAANLAVYAFINGGVMDGDCVTLYDDTWTETRYYKDGKWVEESLYFPGILSAPAVQVETKKKVPGIDDEIREELKHKKFRDWT